MIAIMVAARCTIPSEKRPRPRRQRHRSQQIRTGRLGREGCEGMHHPKRHLNYSIAAFCAAHDLSEGMYFKIRKQGLGPREMRVGSRVLITQEAAAAWRREREAETAAAS